MDHHIRAYLSLCAESGQDQPSALSGDSFTLKTEHSHFVKVSTRRHPRDNFCGTWNLTSQRMPQDNSISWTEKPNIERICPASVLPSQNVKCE